MDAPFRRMIRQMNISLRNMRFYAADHPTATSSVQKAYDALMELLKEKNQLTLGVVDNTLIVNDSPVEESDKFISQFVEELSIRSIESLIFYPDLSQDELRALLQCLNRDADRMGAEGGPQKLFESQGISHVLANEVKYGKIKESSSDGTGLEEAIVAAFLMGKMPASPDDQKNLLSFLIDDPAKIGEMINYKYTELTEKGEGGGGAARQSIGRWSKWVVSSRPGQGIRTST